MEEWKDINGAPGYEVSSLGRIRSKDREVRTSRGSRAYKGKALSLKKVRTNKGKSEYRKVSLGRSRQDWVHRLVARAFIPNPHKKPQIDHIDGDGANNAVSNLRWSTQSENIRNSNTHVNHSSFVFINGKTMHEHSKILGSTNGHMVWKRINRGWCKDCAISIKAGEGTCLHK